jgi:hypothetical protein
MQFTISQQSAHLKKTFLKIMSLFTSYPDQYCYLDGDLGNEAGV